jgi:NAD(P)-dependent dehydrogenase (short-subunit alcohol dehydrogenase family)
VTLAGQVALVTGAGRGVGRAIAARLAEKGAAVALVARTAAEIEAAAAGLPRALAVAADVADETAVEAAVARTEAELGPVSLLVAAAGMAEAVGPAWEADPAAWRHDVETSLVGSFLCARAVLPAMVERGAGRIVLVASHAAVRPAPFLSAYAAAKAGVVALAEALAAETRPHGLAVFAVTPGFVETGLTQRLAESGWHDELAGRKGLDPRRAADLVAALASGRADRLSGRFLHALDDLDELVAHADEIEREDLYAPRLRRL